jgi:signal transduction histidine kinase
MTETDNATDGGRELDTFHRYGALRRNVVLAASLVAVIPLLIMTVLSAVQYEKVYRAEAFGPIGRRTASVAQNLEFFLEERGAALRFVVGSNAFADLQDHARLQEVFHSLSQAFGGFVDLGLIDADGNQTSYVGPYDLLGRNYSDQDWFHEVRLRGVHVSDVFLGFRDFPHFVIAVKHGAPDGSWYVLRATIDSEELAALIRAAGRIASSDAFLVNRAGLLQTPSRNYGDVLDELPFPLPERTGVAEVEELETGAGDLLLVGYSYLENTPFVFLLVNRPQEMMARWHRAQRELIIFAGVSVLLILAVVWFSATHLVHRIREADRKQAAVLHKAEYTQRMATLGRLAAGVAHEINNPLAIIGEKSGLIGDIMASSATAPHREKILQLVRSIANSVDRASRVTHRLLGFARHIDVERERISMPELIREVLGFLEKEAVHRDVEVRVDVDDDLPMIESDRGQLQQVFLNIINNALAAVEDHSGRIDIDLLRIADDRVAVAVTDNGAGIERDHLERIFEPFFTTKGSHGTGLGLSITYGIVKKLGGDIIVDSEVGRWTRFRVELPLTAPQE